MTPSRNDLIKVAAELKQIYSIQMKNPRFTKTEELTALIVDKTDNGTNLDGLSEESIEIVKALTTTDEQDAPAESEAETDADNENEVSEAPDAENAESELPENEEDESEKSEADESELPENDGEDLPEDLTSRAALNIAALDMNDVMGLEPGIDIKLDDKLFMKAFRKGCHMAKGNDNFKEYTWQVFAANNIGPERILAKPIKAKHMPKKETNTDKKAPKKTGKKGVGIIATIKQTLIDAYNAGIPTISRDAIHKILVGKFPERNPDSLMSTIKVQVPGNMTRERGFVFERKERDVYLIKEIPNE